MRVVIIDDDIDYQEILLLQLESKGFKVFRATSGMEGIRLIQNFDPDLVILDVSIPYMDGWEICETLRSFTNVPLLMVSAVAKEESDVIRALSLGADSYLSKPISSDLLHAQIHALLRRSSDVTWKQERPAYIDEYLKVDLYRQEVIVKHSYVSLTDLEFRLLEFLIIHSDEAITNLEIIETLWGENGNENERSVDYVRIYIGRLRRRIEPNPSQPIYIHNVHGIGYRFCSQI